MNVPFGDVTYRLASNSANQNLFYISTINKQGVIYLRRSQTGLTSPQFRITVEACDGGSPPQCTPQVVTINVVRNRAPKFSALDYKKTILETTPNNTVVFNLNPTDLDTLAPFNTLTCDMIGDPPAPEVFTVDAPCDVTLRAALNIPRVKRDANPDTDKSYQIRVRVQDGGSPRLSSTTLIALTIDRNLNTPRFTHGNIQRNIFESHSLELPIVNVNATDVDRIAPYNVVKYRFIKQNVNVQQYLRIDENTGEVYLKKPLNEPATPNTFTFDVQGYDGGNKVTPTNVRVTITVDRNQFGPTFTQTEYTRDILPTQPASQSFFQFPVTDGDTKSPYNVVTCSVIGDDRGPVFFSLKATKDFDVMLKPGVNLATDTATDYVIRIRCQDGGDPRKTAYSKLTIKVNRNVNAPMFTPTSYCPNSLGTIADSDPVGKKYITVKATDLDTNTDLIC
ncbi:protocadherin-1-like [Tubulanus polymorphus]|uniref:protocadherin-1-like n=1 Tax=Tubulanus polymorphus TaxID=672921 RepID=UPI003DA4B0B1